MALAADVGSKLRGGETIQLVSDLGGGKTAFVRGLAKGMGSTDSVHSPSFTLSNQYKAKDLTLYHYDFHRLENAGIMREQVAEALADPKAVLAVEWADIIEGVLPADRVVITIKTTGENNRHLEVMYPKEYNYLFRHNS